MKKFLFAAVAVLFLSGCSMSSGATSEPVENQTDFDIVGRYSVQSWNSADENAPRVYAGEVEISQVGERYFFEATVAADEKYSGPAIFDPARGVLTVPYSGPAGEPGANLLVVGSNGLVGKWMYGDSETNASGSEFWQKIEDDE